MNITTYQYWKQSKGLGERSSKFADNDLQFSEIVEKIRFAITHRQFSITIPEVLQTNIEKHYRCISSDYWKLQYSEMYWKDPIPQLVSRKNTIEERQTSKLCCFFKYSSRYCTEKQNRLSKDLPCSTGWSQLLPNFGSKPLWRTRTQKFVEQNYVVFLTLAW